MDGYEWASLIRRRRIVVVDDNADLRAMGVDLLVAGGHDRVRPGAGPGHRAGGRIRMHITRPASAEAILQALGD